MTWDERGNAAISFLELRNQTYTKGQPSFCGISDKAITGLLLALGMSLLNHIVSVLNTRGKLKMELLIGGGVTEPLLTVKSGSNS